MADNSNDETLNNPTSIQPENLSAEIISTNEKNIITPKQETENMEAHHHNDLHHKSKKWKNHLLEFLMIFLALT